MQPWWVLETYLKKRGSNTLSISKIKSQGCVLRYMFQRASWHSALPPKPDKCSTWTWQWALAFCIWQYSKISRTCLWEAVVLIVIGSSPALWVRERITRLKNRQIHRPQTSVSAAFTAFLIMFGFTIYTLNKYLIIWYDT